MIVEYPLNRLNPIGKKMSNEKKIGLANSAVSHSQQLSKDTLVCSLAGLNSVERFRALWTSNF